MQKPSFTELVEAANISRGYASNILNGKQAPSRPLAIHIFRQTGWKHPLIAELTEAQIDTLEAVDPWTPRQEAPAERLRA